MRRVLCLLMVLAGCKQEPSVGVASERLSSKKVLAGEAVVGHQGKRLTEGDVTDLRVSPDGAFATFLLEAEKPRVDGIPPLMRLGALHAVPTAGGPVRKLGNGVINTPGGYVFTPDGRYALVLIGFNIADQTGELRAIDLKDPSADSLRLAGRASYVLASPDSTQVAFVDEGVLRLGPLPKGPFREIAAEVATAQFSRDGSTLFFRRRVAAAAGLFSVKLAEMGKPPQKIADQVGDFRFSADGALLAIAAKTSAAMATYDLYVTPTAAAKPKLAAQNVIAFQFSPDGKYLAHNEGASPDEPEALFVGPSNGAKADELGPRVRDFKFLPDGSGVLFRQRFAVTPDREGEGELVLKPLPSGEAVKLGKKVSSYALSPDGATVAFVVKVIQPMPSKDLYVYKRGAEAAVKVKNWVYDYDFTPQSDRLLFRADCIRDGRACDLLALDTAKPSEAPKKLIEGIFGFRLSRDGGRLLVTYARAQKGDFYDVGVFNLKSGERKTLEQFILMPPYFLDEAGSRVAYAVGAKNRTGVYVADSVP